MTKQQHYFRKIFHSVDFRFIDCYLLEGHSKGNSIWKRNENSEYYFMEIAKHIMKINIMHPYIFTKKSEYK
jgi:hypothetical protein